MSTPAGQQRAGRWWVIAQAGCLASILAVMAPFLAAVPVRWRHLTQVVVEPDPISILGLPTALEAAYTLRLLPAEAEAWRSMGFSLEAYAAYVLTLEVGLAVVCALVGLFIVWRSTEGWLTLWMATVLALLGTGSVAPELPTLSTVQPLWWSVFISIGMLGMVSNLHLLFLVPDGRFVPRWTWSLAAGFTGAMLALGYFTNTVTLRWGPWGGLVGILIGAPPWVILLGVGLFSQVYRYRRVSNAIQRQQLKWVGIGLAAITLGMLINAIFLNTAGLDMISGPARVWFNLARVTLVNVSLLALPVCLAFSILRYRLWDIDLILRRTLIYSTLTAILAGAYVLSVLTLQALLRALTGQGQNQVVTVISTLAIAALFVPLRSRVQWAIDRRFYRRKYDAARTLAAFGAALRDETDLAQLSERLCGVVDETMQPTSVRLWLK